MKSRKKILNSLREAQAVKVDLPELVFKSDENYLIERFVEMATLSGMEVFDAAKIDLSEILQSLEKNLNIQSALEVHQSQFPVLYQESDPFNKENTPDVFIFQAHFAVAENAAMWLDDEVLPARILAFLPEELIIILPKEQIVATMHEAYERVQRKDYSYGLFIAGPSKTADIEQTLVTGAQGAKRVRVFLKGGLD